MSEDTMHTQDDVLSAAHETLIAGMRNAHALEKQAISVMEGQLSLLTEYPDLHERMTAHIAESRDQARRLEAGLEACGASPSMIKDAFLSLMGLGQSSVQGFADDAVLKAVLATSMTEHLEIASYRSLLVLADMAGKPDLRPRLEETLREEEAMAAWCDEHVEAITRRFVEIKGAQQKADAKPKDDGATQKDEADESGEAPRTPWYARETSYGSDAKSTPTAEPSTEPSTGRTPDNPTATASGDMSRTPGG